MARRVFYSFHYDRDAWRVSQIRNMGVIEGQPLLSSNQWEAVKAKGDEGIRKWIDEQMKGKSCVVVLIGRQTADRRWVKYEIEKGWNEGKGLLGVHIHNLEDQEGQRDLKGPNPFDGFTLGDQKLSLSSIVKAYDPPYTESTKVYNYLKLNLAEWVEEAIDIRNAYGTARGSP